VIDRNMPGGSASRFRAQRGLRTSFAVIALVLLGAACAVSPKRKDELEYLTLACDPGSQQDCSCDLNGRGTQVCLPDGSGYGECEECSGAGTCTTYPNCDGCFYCLETCMCQDSARHPADCQKRCPAP
jgi:hypothetical protein